MSIHYQPAQLADLTEIMTIENQGFTPEEAASETSMAERIQVISDTFITAKDDQGQVLGYIVGPADNARYINDDLFDHTTPNNPTAAYQTVLSLAVHDDAQGKGIASQLLKELAKVAKAQHRQAITLTCLERLIPFYERNGYVNAGVAESDHAGEVWYNLIHSL
ncbi:GNAT family N-acetyltransferase [Secundilactobacillus similis]|uniref:N-acetyltransferase GCN5 n=1 Tax=Secundilactobacillus similis DSM 23365 = JCM 2765 TaxID=1423804 RepID=A0A0R2FC62_9LACO|nr:GNAT family N-acetyltransferase [Secundilactobacillus similis]KRN26095.1 N-acetyltransferase GCN5 [Secundilactobacillus similis DSM 23365 = JCM 2765]